MNEVFEKWYKSMKENGSLKKWSPYEAMKHAFSFGMAWQSAVGTASDYERVLLVLKSGPNPLNYEKDCDLGRAYRSWFYAAQDKLEADEQGLEPPPADRQR